MSQWMGWILTILICIAFILGGYNLYNRLEIVESVEKITLSGEARKNPLYAARIFLNRMGIPASTKESLQGLGNLPSTDTVLIISSKRTTLSGKATDDLYTWIKAGGHLIVRTTVDNDYSSFLDNMDQTKPISEDPLQALLEVESGNRIKIKQQEAFLEFATSERPLRLDINWFNPIIRLNNSRKNDEIIQIKADTFILRRSIGQGMVTLLADLTFIDNRKIRKADHAEIFWHLVHGLGSPNDIWLIHNDEMPALWQLLWNKAWALIITLTILFILWLYVSAHRFGPLIPKAAEDRRSLLEHIRASGHFYWKHQQKAKLIASTREALNQRLALTLPNWQQLSEAEKIAQLALRLERPKAEIQQLLFDSNNALKKNQSDEFIQLIKQLEQIRHSL